MPSASLSALRVRLPPPVVRALLSVMPFVAVRLIAIIRPESAEIAFVTAILSATTVTSPVAVTEPKLAAAFQFTVSVPASPLIVTAPRKAPSIDVSAIVSSPVPALIVNEPVGLAKLTDSLRFESIVRKPSLAVPSVSVIVSVPPINVKIRSIAIRLSVTGSNPV